MPLDDAASQVARAVPRDKSSEVARLLPHERLPGVLGDDLHLAAFAGLGTCTALCEIALEPLSVELEDE